MSRPAEVTVEHVIQAGEALVAGGTKPEAITGSTLRARLGRGNVARLGRLWDEHLATRGAAAAAPDEVHLPEPMAARVAETKRGLDALALALYGLARDQFQDAVSQAQEAVMEAEERRRAAGQEAEQQIEDLTAELAAAQEAAATHAEARARAEAVAAEREHEIERLRADLAAAVQRGEEAREARAAAEALADERQKSIAQLQAALEPRRTAARAGKPSA